MKKSIRAFSILDLVFTLLAIAGFVLMPFVGGWLLKDNSLLYTFAEITNPNSLFAAGTISPNGIILIVCASVLLVLLIAWFIMILANRRPKSLLSWFVVLFSSAFLCFFLSSWVLINDIKGNNNIFALVMADESATGGLNKGVLFATLAFVALANVSALIAFLVDLVYIFKSPKPKKRVYASTSNDSDRLVLVRDEPTVNGPSSDEIRALLHDELGDYRSVKEEQPVANVPVQKEAPVVQQASPAVAPAGIAGPLLVQYINTFGPQGDDKNSKYVNPYPCQMHEPCNGVPECNQLAEDGQCKLLDKECYCLNKQKEEQSNESAEENVGPSLEEIREKTCCEDNSCKCKDHNKEECKKLDEDDIRRVFREEIAEIYRAAEAEKEAARHAEEVQAAREAAAEKALRTLIHEELANILGNRSEEVAPAPVAAPAPKEAAPAPVVKEEVAPAPVTPVSEPVSIPKETQGVTSLSAAPVAAPAPVAEVESDSDKPKIIRIPFTDRMLTADKNMKDQYNELKSEILAYGMNSRVSNSGDAFRLHRKTYVKIAIAGKSLKLYLALDPKDYENTTLPISNAGSKNIYKDIPLVFKVRSDLSLRRAKQLIGDAMEKDKLEQGPVEKHDWVKEIKNSVVEDDE